MNAYLETEYYHNTIFEWGRAGVYIVLTVLIGKIFYWLLNRVVKKITSRTATKLDDILIDKIEEPLTFAVVSYGLWLAFHSLKFPDNEVVQLWVERIYYLLIVFNVTWLIVRIVDALIEEYVVPLVEKTDSDLDDQLIPILRKGMKWLIWSLGIVVGLDNAGFDVTAIIAGLGIGGLAFALAAQDTVKNLIGGITIFIDKPFKINDRVQVNGFDGIIVEIGIRSTRIKTLEGRIVTVPNSDISNAGITNVTSEPSRKVIATLGLTYDTTPEKMREAITTLKEISSNCEGTEDDAIVFFNEFGASSMDITFIYYIKGGAEIPDVKTDINMTILEEFNKRGLDFAFPTQTIYTVK